MQFYYGPAILQNYIFLVFCYCSSTKTDMAQFFKDMFPFSWMNFQDYFKKFKIFAVILPNMGNNIGGTYIFINTRDAILMTTSCVVITFDYVLIF